MYVFNVENEYNQLLHVGLSILKGLVNLTPMIYLQLSGFTGKGKFSLKNLMNYTYQVYCLYDFLSTHLTNYQTGVVNLSLI